MRARFIGLVVLTAVLLGGASNPATAQTITNSRPAQIEQGTKQLLDAVQLGDARQPDFTRQRVEQLIEELGAESYATRVRAQELLQRLGLAAFEQLQAAQTHPDIEVEMAAKYLVSSLMISWSKEADPQVVKEILHEYGAQNESERLKRIGMLEFLANRSGLEALVRLVRYEKSDGVSREAALSVLRQNESSDDRQRVRNAEVIRQGISQSPRRQAEWLNTYASDLENGSYSEQKWREILGAQREELDKRHSSITSESVLELVRTCAGFAKQRDHRDEAIRLVTEHLDLLEPTTRNLSDACTWALANGLHEFILEIREEFRYMFDKQPALLYSAAEAHQINEDQEAADALAKQAISISAFPQGEQVEKMSPRDLEDLAIRHLVVAKNLQDRGLFRWSFREYELVISNTGIETIPNCHARLKVAGLYKSHLMHEDTIRVLEPLVERMEKDEKLESKIINRLGASFDLDVLRGMLDNALAQRALASQRLKEAQGLLEKAYHANMDNPDIDILIQMYHTEGDRAWKEKVKQWIEKTARKFEADIANERKVRRNGQLGQAFNLAELLNNYAWLIANTEGDQNLALKCSLESLEERRDGARLDTCARCYFALGRLEEAIATQKEAIKEMPHMPELQRQLAEFEKKLAEQTPEKTP